MAKTMSTSLYGSSTNKGFGGLVSGLDTDDLVNQMTARTRNKINRQYQSKQKLLYKQEAYREVSSKLLSFSNKYFSNSTATSNILNPSFFKANTFESSSKYVSVSGNADNIKNFSISDISSVATNASFASSKVVSEHTFKSGAITDFTSTLAGETMSIEYDGKTYNLTIDNDFGKILKDVNGDIRTGESAKVTLKDVADQLNKQLATIKDDKGVEFNKDNKVLNYTVVGDQIKFDQNTTGKTAKLTAASTKILDVLNLKTGQVAESTDSIVTTNLTTKKEDIFSNKDAYMTFDFNGVQKTIKLNDTIKGESALQIHLQTELNKAYGDGKVTVKYDEGTKKLNFTALGENNLFGVSGISKELRYFTGIEPTTYNRINTNVAIGKSNLATAAKAETLDSGKKGYSLSVNGTKFDFEETATLSDIMSTINNNVDAGVNIYYSSTTDTFTVKSTATGSNSGVEIKDLKGTTLAQSLFGKSANSLVQPGEFIKNENGVQSIYKLEGTTETKIGTIDYIKATSDYTIKYVVGQGTDISGISYVENKGTDTTMTYTLNGVQTKVTRSTADFSIDGINVSLSEKAASATKDSPVTFTVTNNTNEVVERVKQFITDYNELISLMNTKTSEKPNREYQPLVPEQSDKMDDKEIENWTKEAKKGILFGDSKINNVLNGIRGAMSGMTSVSTITLADIGISVASMDTSGKLTFDEEKFKMRLAQNSDDIVDLFSGTTTEKNAVSGLAVQVKSILSKNIGNYGSTGILVEEAGMDNSITSDRNYISEKIKEYNDNLKVMKKDLQKERERYWNKFTSLEKTMSKLNTQSSWFTSNMGS